MKEKKKLYYSVLTGCLMLIIGVSAVIYNSSLPNVTQETLTTTRASLAATTRTSQEQIANVPATGVPKPTTTTAQITTVPADEKPYTGSFTEPTDGKVITDFSAGEMVKSSTMGDWRVHNGVDFSAEKNETVYAVQNASVENIDKDPLWGVCVTLACADGLQVRYCGLADSLTIKTGDTVQKGDAIGQAGDLPIESADGTHIHLETTVNGEVVNPLKALNLL